MKIALISTCLGDLGIRSLSAFLKQMGHETYLYFLYSTEDQYNKALLDNLKDHLLQCDLVGFSTRAISFGKTLQILDHVRDLDIPIVLGGIQATLDPEMCLEHADIVCVGEGEEALAELVERIENNQEFYDVRNFYFKKDRRIITNPLRPLIKNLDDLPFPDYDAENHYTISNGKIQQLGSHSLTTDHPSVEHQHSIFVYTMRGCPYRCLYCHNRKTMDIYSHERKNYVRKRGPIKMVQEVESLGRNFPDLSYIYFMDDDFFVMRTVEEIRVFAAEYKKKIGLPFWVYCTPKSLTAEKLEPLIEAGLKTISMGIQSASYWMEDFYERRMYRENILKACRIIEQYRAKHGDQMDMPIYDVLINNPMEDEESMLETIKLLMELPKPFEISAHSVIFFPGTDLHCMALEKGIISEDYKGWAYNFHDTPKHIRIHRKAIPMYLNSLIYWMNGKFTRRRFGLIPSFLVPILISKPMRRLAKKLRNVIYLFDLFVPTKTRLFFLMQPKPIKRLWQRIFTKD